MKDFVLTNEERQFIEDNHNVIYSFISKKGLAIDDWYGLLAIKLCELVKSWNPNKGAFSTLAYKAFSNVVIQEYRKSAKSIQPFNCQSLDDVADIKTDERQFYLVEDICNDIDMKCLICDIFDTFEEQEKIIAIGLYHGKTMVAIGKELGVSKQRVEQIRDKIRDKCSDFIFKIK